MTPVLKFASLRVVAAASAGLLLAASSLATPVTHAAPGNVAGMIVFLDPGHNGANDAVDDPPGAYRPRRHQGLPDHRHQHRRRLRRAHLQLGHRAADPAGAEPARGAHRDVARQRRPGRPVRRRTRGDGQRPAAQRGGLDPRRRRSGHRPRLPHPVLQPAAERRLRPGRRCSSPGSCATRLAGSGIPPSTYIGTDGLNPRADIAGSEPRAVPVDPRRAGQHEEPGGLGH